MCVGGEKGNPSSVSGDYSRAENEPLPPPLAGKDENQDPRWKNIIAAKIDVTPLVRTEAACEAEPGE